MCSKGSFCLFNPCGADTLLLRGHLHTSGGCIAPSSTCFPQEAGWFTRCSCSAGDSAATVSRASSSVEWPSLLGTQTHPFPGLSHQLCVSAPLPAPWAVFFSLQSISTSACARAASNCSFCFLQRLLDLDAAVALLAAERCFSFLGMASVFSALLSYWKSYEAWKNEVTGRLQCSKTSGSFVSLNSVGTQFILMLENLAKSNISRYIPHEQM